MPGDPTPQISFDDFVMSDPNNPEPLNNALTRFQLVQPIYTGGQIEPRIELHIGYVESKVDQSDQRQHRVGHQQADQDRWRRSALRVK